MDNHTPSSLSFTTSWSLLKCKSIGWCYPTISSSVVPFSCLQSFPASGSFQMSQLFVSGDQSTGVSASASVLPMNIPLGCGLVGSPGSPRDSQESSPTPEFKSIDSLVLSLLYGSTLTSIHPNFRKNHSFDHTNLCYKVMSLLRNMLSRFVIRFIHGASIF